MIKHNNWNKKQKQACSAEPYEWQKWCEWTGMDISKKRLSSLSCVPHLHYEQSSHSSPGLPCMAVVEFPNSLENAWVTMWNCRCSSWAYENGSLDQRMPPAPHLEMGPRLAETWYLKEYAKCRVLPGWRSHAGREGEETHAVRLGGRPMEETTTGSWSELINHFDGMAREAFACSVAREDLQTPPHIGKEGEHLFLFPQTWFQRI